MKSSAATLQEDLIFDVGMHRGEDTDFYLKKGFRVVAFEADPNLVADARDRFAEQLRNSRLKIVEGAIAHPSPNSTDTIKFIRNLTKSEWGTVCPEWANRPQNRRTRTEVVTVRRIDFLDVLRESGVPYYLKVDVEGADRICLESLREFSVRPKYVSIESEKVSFPRLLDEFRLLTELGYSRFKLVQQANVQQQTEPSPAREGVFVGHVFEAGSSGAFGKDLEGEWITARQAIQEYRRIFLLYRILGDNSLIRRFSVGRYLMGIVSRALRTPIPGWYDTHATRSD